MLKWILGIVMAIVLLIGGLRIYGSKIILIYPELLPMLSRLVDPIEETREVSWEQGPTTPSRPAAERPPNIVVILVDDLGWNDLTWNGGGVANGTVPTPHINSLARDGVQFTNGYAGNATCAPSRAALMTGRYGPRFGFESTPAPPIMGKMVSTWAKSIQVEGAPEFFFFEDLLTSL